MSAGWTRPPGVDDGGMDLPVRTRACLDAVATIEAETFDCIQSNLALLHNAARGGGASRLLGRQLSIVPRPLPSGLYTIDPEPGTEVARCSRLLGFTAGAAVGGGETACGADLQARTAVGAEIAYAIGDAFEMPWLPYFQRMHMPHSFLIAVGDDPDALVVDAYDNQTEWGPIKPGSWPVPWSSLAFEVRVWHWRPGPVAPSSAGIDVQDVASYIAAFRAHEDRRQVWEQLTVESWLLARRYALFAAAHADEPALGSAARDRALRWRQVAADVFLGSRRVRRGRAEPSGVIDEIERLLIAPHQPTAVEPIPD